MNSLQKESEDVDDAPVPGTSPPKTFIKTKEMRDKLEYIEGFLPPTTITGEGSLIEECRRLGLPVTEREHLPLTEKTYQLTRANHTTVERCGSLVLKRYENDDWLWSFFAEAVTMTEARPLRGFQRLVGVLPAERTLVTEYAGRNLAQVLYKDRPSLLQKLEIIKEVVKLIEEMHSSRIIHNDLRPCNICVREREGGGGREITLIDFSLACFSKEKLSLAHREAHSIHFAPELRKGNRRPSWHSDVYSIAHMLKHDFFRDTMGQLPAKLQQWIEGGLQPSKHLRQDLKALQVALKEAAMRASV